MKVKYEGNVLIVDTGINKALMNNKGLRAKDEKGNVVFIVSEGNPNISTSGLTCNAVSADGNLQVLMTFVESPSVDEVKTEFGEALVTAEKYIPVILADVEAKQAAVDRLFA